LSKAVRKTRKQWAAEICAAHKQSIAEVLKIGRTLIAAKIALEHGAFQKMIEDDLPFDASTAQRLMKIARDPRLANAAREQLLPIAWGTLYELTKLPDVEFKRAVASGAINPQMTREQARLVRVEVSEPRPAYKLPKLEPCRTVVPVYPKTIERDNGEERQMRLVTSQTADVLPTDVAPLALSQIERSVGDLEMAGQRGEIRACSVFDGRIRAVAERLLSLIGHHRTSIN
jgi:hypothetical protein